MAKGHAKSKVARAMREFHEGKLHSGSKKGPKVKDRKQAIAIKMSEEGAEKKNAGKYPEKKAKSSKGREKRLEGKEL